MAILSMRKSIGLTLGLVALVTIGLNRVKVQRHPRDIQAKADELPKFTFDDIYSSKFSYESVNPRWISGIKYVHTDSSKNIQVRNVITDDETELMAGAEYDLSNARAYKVSSDQKFIALLTNYKKGWRHSYNGTYLIYDVDAREIRTDINLPDDTQYFAWSPSGSALAYVMGFNIYYMESPGAEAVQVTFDGRANHFYNGIPDWVYEEEMISSNNVMYFSPDGQYLAYAQFDDSPCKHIQFSRYDELKYPEMIDVSYPKAGTAQPTNKVFIYDIASNISSEVEPPPTLSSSDYLFSRVTWADTSRAAVMWCNRAQNHNVMRLCDVNGTDLTLTDDLNFEHKSDSGWVYQRRPYWIPVFGQDNDHFFTVRPNSNWQHLHKVSVDEVSPLTEGDYTVTSESASYPAVEIYNKDNDYIYFSSTKTSPQHRQIFRTKGTPTDPIPEPQCITCKLQTEYPGRCDAISTSFSTDGSYVIVRCGGDGPPLYIQYRLDHATTTEDGVLTDKLVLVANQDLVDNVANTQMPKKEYHTFASTSGYDFTYQIWLPPNFDETKKYPVLIDVYAGPGYQKVVAGWSRSWSSRFVPSSLDVIVASVDGRGSNYYGEDFMHEVYRKLGQTEPLDQLEFAKHLSSMDYVDSSRIAVWGWSYGGYATSLILGNDNDKTIKCGMAVAPLADWRFYDTIYAERYMSLPSLADNFDGYEKASVLPLVKNIHQSRYYLIHGTADDNVHFQNAARIENALVEADIDFNNFFYADQDHSINVGNAYQHVYKVLTRQLCQCFNIEVPAEVWG